MNLGDEAVAAARNEQLRAFRPPRTTVSITHPNPCPPASKATGAQPTGLSGTSSLSRPPSYLPNFGAPPPTAAPQPASCSDPFTGLDTQRTSRTKRSTRATRAPIPSWVVKLFESPRVINGKLPASSAAPTQQSMLGSGGQGTASVPFKPFEEPDRYSEGRLRNQHQSIVFQEPCQNSSHEELRLADYSNGLGPKQGKAPVHVVQTSKGSGTVPLSTANPFMKSEKRFQLELMQGPGIEVIVGPEPDSVSRVGTPCVWSLPKTLLSHYASSLKDACNLHMFAVPGSSIRLPKEEPAIFHLFVEWIYYGSYTLEPFMVTSMHPSVNIHAQAYVLGNTIGATEFKNYAMGRLYDQYAQGFAPKPITIADIEYICTQGAADSKLRGLYLDLLALYFKDTKRVAGDIADWDRVLQIHPRVRMCLLFSMRFGKARAEKLHPKEAYLEKPENSATESIEATNCAKVVPAKRDQDGVAVKKEVTSI